MSGTGYDRQVGAQLRALRNDRKLSLRGLETESGGQWNAVVVGSWERGDRGLSVRKLKELADWYQVPVSSLLPDDPPPLPAAVSEVLERVEDLAERFGELRDLLVLGVSYGSAHDGDEAAEAGEDDE